MPERLQHIYHRLKEIITNYRPNKSAMEELYFGKNTRTALTVGQARGVAMLALANGGLAVSEYTPKQIKLAVAGYGSANKEQVGEMVRILLHLKSIPRPDDAADAAAFCGYLSSAYCLVPRSYPDLLTGHVIFKYTNVYLS